MEDNYIYCPMVDKDIEDIDCIENRDVVDGLLPEKSLPNIYKKKNNWKELCKNCKWHSYQ